MKFLISLMVKLSQRETKWFVLGHTDPGGRMSQSRASAIKPAEMVNAEIRRHQISFVI